MTQYFDSLGQRARDASRIMARATTAQKTALLDAMYRGLAKAQDTILKLNADDVKRAREAGRDEAFLDRLALNPTRYLAMMDGVRAVMNLADPIGEITGMHTQPSGIQVGQMRVPLGVIGMIYEARPNVTIDAATLGLWAGNAMILRGGSEAIQTNKALVEVIHAALTEVKLPAELVQFIDTPDRDVVDSMITANQWLDVLIPRGGKSLIRRLQEKATVPMIKHLDGVCHTYVDRFADLEMAHKVTHNAKCQRYAPCNTTETLLIHKSIVRDFLPMMARTFYQEGVEMRADEMARGIIEHAGFSAIDATDEDRTAEYNAPIISIFVVDTLSDAIHWINSYGSHHTDAIITNHIQRAQQFVREVDSSSVMVNASTRFADGFEYGLGAEMGISTDKLHARGPVGVLGLTTLKYLVIGQGSVRQ